jgi:putative ABC transport system substrate-binding protein
MFLRLYKKIAVIFLAALVVSGSILTAVKADTEAVQIVVLMSQDAGHYKEALAGYKEFLAKHDLETDFRVFHLKGDASKASGIVEKISRRKPDLILALGILATKTISGKITDIPIIAGMVLRSDHLLKPPNVTGVVLEYPLDTQFKWLKRFLPEAQTVGVIYNPEENQERIDEANVFLNGMGFTLYAQKVNDPKEIPLALERLAKRADVIWGIPDKVVYNSQTAKHILLFSFRNRIPFIGLSSAWVKAGALYALDWDYADVGRDCGEMTLEVLQGGEKGLFPPATPDNVQFSLNLKAAERMKVEIPEKLVREAKTVY